MAERLQKVLATAGLGSRRACEEIILDGRVRLNGRRVTDLPVLVDPKTDKITVDGQRIAAEPKVTYLLNKPKGVLATQKDPRGRKRAVDLMQGVDERVYPVGRLDADSQGLLLMTNDGDLAAKLTHPRYGVPKTYRARVRGRVGDGVLAKLRQGIWLSEGRTQPARVTLIYKGKEYSILEITLREGRNRQVRRMLAQLGHPVRELTRIRIGKLSVRGLGVGKHRKLTKQQINELYKLIEQSRELAAKKRPARGRKKTKTDDASAATDGASKKTDAGKPKTRSKSGKPGGSGKRPGRKKAQRKAPPRKGKPGRAGKPSRRKRKR